MTLAVVDFADAAGPAVVLALRVAGGTPVLAATAAAVRDADRVVLAAIGDFAPVRRRLTETGIDAAVLAAARMGRPVLAICLGLQLCCSETDEASGVAGLGLLPGRVTRLRTPPTLPHVGWAAVTPTAAGLRHPALTLAFADGTPRFYHVHSYAPASVPPHAVLATADYGDTFPTIIAQDTVVGVQFHLERSREAGIAFLRGFLEWRP